MDLTKVLQQLHDELEYLDAAILSLERLQGSAHRRGRPPAVLAELKKAMKGGTRRKEQKPPSDSPRK
jgi:hypothetical protein